jgi:intracellular multiplication protein IcmG
MSEEENLPFDKDEGDNEEDYHFTEEDFADFEGDDTSDAPVEKEAAATSALMAKESSSDKPEGKFAAILAKLKSIKQPAWFKKVGRKKLIIGSVFVFLFAVGLSRIVFHQKSADDGFNIQAVQQSSTAQIKSISDQFNQQDAGRAQIHKKSAPVSAPVAAVETISPAPVAADTTPDDSLNNAVKERASSRKTRASSSGDVSKLQSQYKAVKSTQRSDSRRIKQLERKNQAISDNVESLSQQVTGLQSNLEQISGQLTLLNNKLSQQAEHVSKSHVSAKKERAVPAEEDRVQQHRRAYSRLSYFVEAVIPGRAWLQSSTGRTITVTTGDEIYGYGRITAINPYNGEVKTSSGKNFNYGSGAQN